VDAEERLRLQEERARHKATADVLGREEEAGQEEQEEEAGWSSLWGDDENEESAS